MLYVPYDDPNFCKVFFFFSGCFGVAETAKFIHELLSRPQACVHRWAGHFSGFRDTIQKKIDMYFQDGS